MSDNTFHINRVKLTVWNKTEFEMVGYKKSVNFGDGSIGLFINHLIESGKMEKLTHTLPQPQQVWVCLSDCQSCERGCSDAHVCCRVCVEKTDQHDFSQFADGELAAF